MGHVGGANERCRGALASTYKYGVFFHPFASESTSLVNWGVSLAPMLSCTHTKITPHIFGHHWLRWRSPLIVHTDPKFRFDLQWALNSAMAISTWYAYWYIYIMTIYFISELDTTLCSVTTSLETPNWCSVVRLKIRLWKPLLRSRTSSETVVVKV